MAQQANRIPSGFLDLIGAETGGKNPPIYADFVQPSVELLELYAAQTLANVNETIAHTAAGTPLTITVTEGETWLLRSCSVLTTMPAASFERWSVRIRRVPRGDIAQLNGFPDIWTSRMLVPNAVGLQQDHDSFYLPTPLACLAGTEIEFILAERDALASRTSRCQLLLNRLET